MDVHDVHRRRLRADKDIAAIINDRVKEVARKREAAAAVLKEAQTMFNDLKAEEQRLLEMAIAANRNLQKSRKVSLRSYLAAFPDAVLQGVLEYLADTPDECWSVMGAGTYNESRAHIPFVLASVCKKWRRVALATPRLWSYICLPAELNKSQSVYLNTLLQRSKAAPLDILLRWEDAVFSQDTDDSIFFTTYRAIKLHTARWRRFELWLPGDAPHRYFYDVLRRPLPILEQLSITDDRNDEPPPKFLVYAPRLKELDFTGANVEFTVDSPSNFFPSLTRLSIIFETNGSWVERALRGVHDTVEFLTVGIPTDNAVISGPITLPRLKSLAIRNEPYFWRKHARSSERLLEAPQLHILTLNVSVINASWLYFMPKHIADQITELWLDDEWLAGHSVSQDQLNALRVLNRVIRVRFGVKESVFESAVGITDEVLSDLGTSRPFIWPRLSSISIENRRTDNCACNRDITFPVNPASLLTFLAARNAAAAVTSDNERPSKIQEVDLDYPHVPAWLLEEVQHILAR